MISVVDLTGNGEEMFTFVGRLTVVMVAKGGKPLLLYCARAKKTEVWGYHMQLRRL